MNKAAVGAFVVVGAAILGLVVYGAAFWIIAMFIDRSLVFQPLDRAINFALTFGLVGGAFVGASSVDRTEPAERNAVYATFGLLLLAALAILFLAGGWTAIFSGGAAEWTMIFIWGLSVGWLARTFGK